MDLTSGYQHQFWDDAPDRGPGHGFWGVQYPRLARALRQQPPKAILLPGWLFAGYWQAAALAKWLGIPYILRGESNLLSPRDALTWFVKRQTIGRLSRGAAACLAIGSHNARLYQTYGVPQERIWNAPYFVDNDWFTAERQRLEPQRQVLRAKFGLPADATVFLFMGKLIRKKQPDHLVKAWQSLSPDHRARSALLVVGSGAMQSELEALAAGEPRIVFPGMLNRRELPEAYAASDALVLPSDAGETWGLVVNEAMASRRAVVVSDLVGCAPDLVRDGETGFIVPFGDLSALAEKLRILIDDPGRLGALGRAGEQHVVTASLDGAVQTTLAALAQVPRCQPATPVEGSCSSL
jgi:glycosyltransferase involved in cell wall biosynthesis